MKKPLTEVRETFYYRQNGEDRALELVYATPNGNLVNIKPVYGGGSFENIPLKRALECLSPAKERDVRQELANMQRSLESFKTLCNLCFAQTLPKRTPATGFSDNLSAEIGLESRRTNFGKSGEYP